MRTIPELLDLAKVRSGIKSDRQLGSLLGRSNIAPYRTKGEIPNDKTAFKLAKLCGLPAEEVLITCHLWRIKSGGDVMEAWGRVFKKVVGAAIVLYVSLTASPTPSSAACTINSQSEYNIHYATLIMSDDCQPAHAQFSLHPEQKPNAGRAPPDRRAPHQ